MTCAACASRIERKLNKLEGVEATVNFATEQAAVAYDAERVELDDLIAAVAAAGYRATPLDQHVAAVPDDLSLRRRFAGAAGLTVPLLLLSMIGPLHFRGWEWLALALATPVVLWAGADFHRS